MKFLTILSLLSLSSCGPWPPTSVNPTELKFSAGDKVSTSKGFYSACEGVVVDYIRWRDQEGPAYHVSFTCPNVGKMDQFFRILEKDLIKRG